MDTIKTVSNFQETTQNSEIRIGAKSVESKRSDLKTSKLSLLNPYYVYFPKFYKKEVRNSVIVFLLWLASFTIFSIVSTILLINLIGFYKQKATIVLLFVPAFIIMLTFLIVYACRYHSFNEEAKVINFKDEKVLSINIQKLYKRLKVGYININWMCGLSYIACGFSILILMVVSQILHMYEMSASDAVSICFTPAWTDEFIVFFVIMFILTLTFVLHIILIVTNYLRCSRIENYYNTFIVLPEEITALKKQANKRNFIIFCIVLFFFGFFYWIIRKILGRKKAQATVIVK